jgi:hypothetical protein
MARSEVTVHVRVIALSGLATCGVCGTLVSFEVRREEFDTKDRITCPECGGTAHLHESSVVPVIEVSPPSGGLE